MHTLPHSLNHGMLASPVTVAGKAGMPRELMSPTGLQVDYMSEPRGVDRTRVHFTWQVRRRLLRRLHAWVLLQSHTNFEHGIMACIRHSTVTVRPVHVHNYRPAM